jgi:hypothetical protein
MAGRRDIEMEIALHPKLDVDLLIPPAKDS